jgi:hypothetical protein
VLGVLEVVVALEVVAGISKRVQQALGLELKELVLAELHNSLQCTASKSRSNQHPNCMFSDSCCIVLQR